ncbi:hypothetical protein B296_00036921 [Ensete ventricosum]|uniref:Uncharacterized protein n=1 Tax=Ensete ventricosum TaxID=4639 RepID=A0A426YCW6_ENSVE|nr:hypothetical protein B296_00036921 [Ensete ventricosum]
MGMGKGLSQVESGGRTTEVSWRVASIGCHCWMRVYSDRQQIDMRVGDLTEEAVPKTIEGQRMAVTPGSRAANTSRLCSWSCRFGRRKGHKRHSGRRGAIVERMQSKKRGRCKSVPSKVGDDTMERAALWRYWRVVFLQVSCKSCRSYCLAVIWYVQIWFERWQQGYSYETRMDSYGCISVDRKLW